MKCIAIAALVPMLLAAPALARPVAAEGSDYHTCTKQALTDYQLSECNAAEFQRQDKVLNKVYRDLVERSDEAGRAALQKSERAWVVFRDAQCNYEYEQEGGGTMQRVVWSSCRLSMTRDRLDVLKHFIELERKYGK